MKQRRLFARIGDSIIDLCISDAKLACRELKSHYNKDLFSTNLFIYNIRKGRKKGKYWLSLKLEERDVPLVNIDLSSVTEQYHPDNNPDPTVPITDISIYLRTSVPEIARMYDMDYHVKISTMDESVIFMNMFPKRIIEKDFNKNAGYNGNLSIGFSPNGPDSKRQEQDTNRWYLNGKE